jgi:hypothetical protein
MKYTVLWKVGTGQSKDKEIVCQVIQEKHN